MSIEAVQESVLEINQKLGFVCSDVGHIKEKLVKIEAHLDKQNGRIGKGEEERKEMRIEFTELKTRHDVESKFNEKDHKRTEKSEEENRKINLDNLRRFGNMVMTIVLFIITIMNFIK